MKILICILTSLFSELAYPKSFSPQKFEITGNERASGAIKTINEALKLKKYYEWSNTFDDKSRIMLNGIAVENVSVRDGDVIKFQIKEDVEIGKLIVPAPADFSVSEKSEIYLYTLSKKSHVRFDGLFLSNKDWISIDREGKLFTAVSGKFQNYNGIQFFKNDIILSDKKGEITFLSEVRHFGKRYNLRDYQRDKTLQLEPLRVSRINNRVHLVLGFTDKSEHFGNKCKHCEYTLCQNDDHFYVYMISSIDYKNDIFQGQPIKDKFDQEQYFKDGDSTKPIVRDMERDEPFTKTCSFEPFKG